MASIFARMGSSMARAWLALVATTLLTLTGFSSSVDIW